jgi:hypothetical protein
VIDQERCPGVGGEVQLALQRSRRLGLDEVDRDHRPTRPVASEDRRHSLDTALWMHRGEHAVERSTQAAHGLVVAHPHRRPPVITVGRASGVMS